MLLSLLLLTGSALGTPAGGKNAAACGNCVFPFIYDRRQSDRCTTIDGDSRPWCATAVDSAGNMLTKEYCQDTTCPGMENGTPSPMTVHPQNAVGQCYCGIPNRADNNKNVKIVGGVKTETGEFPWQVALLFYGSSLGRQGCGGTLVGKKYVITAAHCTDGMVPANLKVRIGDTNLDEEFEANSTTKEVKTIKQHPGYNSMTLANDISVLELAEEVPLDTHPNIKPACLPSAGATFPGEAIVSGWGTVASGSYLTSYLNEVGVTVFPDGDCGAMNDEMTDDMLCAGLKEGGKDACQGDSGGPLVTTDPSQHGAMTLVGVVSWGYGCAGKDALGIYSEVSHFTQWIQDQMTGHDPSTCPPYPGGWNTPSGSTAPPTAVPTTPATTPTTGPECYDGQYPKEKMHKKIKKVENWEDCRDYCDAEPACEFFKYKDHNNVRRRLCFLMKVDWVQSESWVSGEKFCV